MNAPSTAQNDPRLGASGVGAGVSLLVLLTLSMQIVLGGDGQVASLRGQGESARVCVKRLPTAMVRVIRDLTERREPAAAERAPIVSAPAERLTPVTSEGEIDSLSLVLGEWLLDLPPPAVG